MDLPENYWIQGFGENRGRDGRRRLPGLGLGEVACISLAREESQESYGKRVNSCKGL
jgi:hypothetical protein